MLILAAALLWGTTGTSQALAPSGANPVALGTFRLITGALALLAVALMKRSFRSSGPWSPLLIALSAIFIASYQLTFFAAVSITGVAVGTMIAIGSSPVAAGLLGYFVRGERLGRRWMAATLLAVIGCTLLAAGGGTLSAKPAGVILALLAGFSYAAYTVSIKGLLDKNSPDAVLAVVFSAAAVIMSPLLLFSDCGWVLSLRGAAVTLHLGLFATAGAYWLFVRGLKTVKIGTAATLSLGEPLTASLLGVLLLGEHLGIWQTVGIILLFSGITILTVGSGRSSVE
ncbi:MAG: EamA family transporter [Geobacteraceae bacterium]|nr:EamA family transporter [Geobacteraceae bacterium]